MIKRRKHSCHDDPDFAALLRQAGLKATQSRLSILQFLFHEHGPFTHEQIFQQLSDKGVDLTTVYRTTSALDESGILVRCEFGDGIARFEYRGGLEAREHHHHIICRGCKKTETLEFCLPDGWMKAVSKLGYSQPGHALEFFGLCKKCQRA